MIGNGHYLLPIRKQCTSCISRPGIGSHALHITTEGSQVFNALDTDFVRTSRTSYVSDRYLPLGPSIVHPKSATLNNHLPFLTPSAPFRSLNTALTGHTNPCSILSVLPSSAVSRNSTRAIPTYAPMPVRICHQPCNSRRKPQGKPMERLMAVTWLQRWTSMFQRKKPKRPLPIGG